MRKGFFLLILAAVLISITGCEETVTRVVEVEVPVDLAPQAPQGVYSITGDGRVTIVWNGLYETDVVEYVVGWNDELLGEYEEVGRVSALPIPPDNRYGFVDTDVINGETYFYAVWAVDAGGHVSEPSLEAVFDTPRPAGTDTLYSLYENSSLSGLDLSTGATVAWNSILSDIYLDDGWLFHSPSDSQRIIYVNAADDATDIQDLGYTSDFDEIDWAPSAGWSDLRYYELLVGHTYVVWTSDFHYAKLRIESINPVSTRVILRWGYQPSDTDLGNPELLPEFPVNVRRQSIDSDGV